MQMEAATKRTKMHCFFIEDDLALYSVGALSQARLGWATEEIRWSHIHFIFDNLEGRKPILSVNAAAIVRKLAASKKLLHDWLISTNYIRKRGN